jgi:hypothetical protein
MANKKRTSSSDQSAFAFRKGVAWESHGIFSDHFISTRLTDVATWPESLPAAEQLHKDLQDLWTKRHRGLAQNEETTRREFIDKVKSCFSPEQPGHTGFPIIVACHWGRGKLGYSIEEIDFIAAFIAPHDTWYLIPIEALGKNKNVRLYPGGRKLKRPGGFYESYREAWQLLKQEETAKTICTNGNGPEIGAIKKSVV